MIEVLYKLPNNVAGFRAIGEITKTDLENVVVPGIEQLIRETCKINFLLVLDTNIGDFTLGAWFQDALFGIKNITKWNRSAICFRFNCRYNFYKRF